jgi:hypothetical protein
LSTYSANSLNIISNGKGKWLVIPEFYRLHYKSFRCGSALLELNDELNPLPGDSDHLVSNFVPWQIHFTLLGGDYPRHERMEAYIPLTQAGTDPDGLEVEVSDLSA